MHLNMNIRTAWRCTMCLRAARQFFLYSLEMKESIRGEEEEENIYHSNRPSCESPFWALTSARPLPTQSCCSLFIGNILCEPRRCLYVLKIPVDQQFGNCSDQPVQSLQSSLFPVVMLGLNFSKSSSTMSASPSELLLRYLLAD